MGTSAIPVQMQWSVVSIGSTNMKCEFSKGELLEMKAGIDVRIIRVQETQQHNLSCTGRKSPVQEVIERELVAIQKKLTRYINGA